MKEQYWLMKSEPDTFSIQDLKKEPKQTAFWDGVRNYQARNFMQKDMKVGDHVLFYHSNAKPPGIAGIAKVASEAYADPTQFDPKSKYFDEKSSPEKPRWFAVEVKLEKIFKELIPLQTLKDHAQFQDMLVTQKGSRLSIQPVAKKHWNLILKMAQ